MAERADVVVIGGGVMGLSAAIHLTEAGAGRVVLLERDRLFEGTSGAGAGFLAPWAALNPAHGPESPAVRVERYSMDFYARLHAAPCDIGYRRVGLLWLAASQPVWEGMADMAWERADPASVQVPPSDVPDITSGVVSSQGLLGARFLPAAAQIDANRVGAALAKTFMAHGGVINIHRPAGALTVHRGRVHGVQTSSGKISCQTVVVAAGAWTNSLLKDTGVFLPAVPQITSRIITEPTSIPSTMPMLMAQGIMRDEPGGGTILWVRAHESGLLWGGMYLTPPRDILVGRPVPPRLEDIPLDGVCENLRVAKAAAFIPQLSRAKSLRVRHGAPCYTPDDVELVGPVPGIQGLYALAGDNEHGFSRAPGLGKILADHITSEGSNAAALDQWRIDRFSGHIRDEAEAFDAVQASVRQLLVGHL